MNKISNKKPDNRMPVTLGKMAVDAMSGYAGKSGNIKVSYDLVSTETLDDKDGFIDYVRAMDDYNNTDIEISELYEEVNQQGYAYEIWWTSDRLSLPNGLLTTEYKIASSTDVYVEYSNDLKKDKLYAVHFSEEEDNNKDIDIATVYYPLYMDIYRRNKGSTAWVLTETLEYPFEEVPVNVYKANREGQCIFEAEKTYIDGIDEIYSKSMNEVDRFNAAIALFGNRWEKEQVEQFKEGILSVIGGLSEDVDNTFIPQYMEKNLSGIKDFYSLWIDKQEEWFRKSVGIADFSDDAFAGQQTGIAILMKLIPMEFRAAQIETYFNQGLNKRLQYYGDVYNASTANVNVDDYTTIIKSKRNIPIDDKTIIENVIKLQGILSEQTLLEYIPESIVSDALKEIERKKASMPGIDLIGGVEDTPIEEQAVEAVKLSGIQITAANDIITLVGLPLDDGGITREAGINQLKIFLGLSDAQANLVMGNKQTGLAKSDKSEV